MNIEEIREAKKMIQERIDSNLKGAGYKSTSKFKVLINSNMKPISSFMFATLAAFTGAFWKAINMSMSHHSHRTHFTFLGIPQYGDLFFTSDHEYSKIPDSVANTDFAICMEHTPENIFIESALIFFVLLLATPIIQSFYYTLMPENKTQSIDDFHLDYSEILNKMQSIDDFHVDDEPDGSECHISKQIATNPVNIIDKSTGGIVAKAVYDAKVLAAWLNLSGKLPCYDQEFDSTRYEIKAALEISEAIDTFMLKQLDKAEKLLIERQGLSALRL